MSSTRTREWLGLQQFPAASQTKPIELLAKLKQEKVDTLNVLVLGKGGVGKSSIVNSLVREQAVRVSAFQSEGLRPVIVSRSCAGFTLNVIDTPGLVEGGFVNYQALDLIKRFLLNKTIDVLLYVDRLDLYRVDDLDKQIFGAISESFGKQIWHRSLLVFTHAQLCPPDGINYDAFCFQRSQAVLKVICEGAKVRRRDLQGFCVPVVLVENSGRCNKNENNEKVVPNGDAWIPRLVKEITSVATCGKHAIKVDEKLIDGSDSNNQGKVWIPLILGVQWFIVKQIQRAIKTDIAGGNVPL